MAAFLGSGSWRVVWVADCAGLWLCRVPAVSLAGTGHLATLLEGQWVCAVGGHSQVPHPPHRVRNGP
jgi:hypothetical protein